MNNKIIIDLDSPEALQQLRQCPRGHYRLTADIDLQGESWIPTDFFGTLDGNGRTICNFRILQATPEGNQGFFGCVGSEAGITSLRLKDLQIEGCPEAVCIGAFAGVNLGTLTDCTVGTDAPYRPIRSKKRNYLTGSSDNSAIRERRGSGVQVGAIAGCNQGVIRGARSYLRLLVPPGLRTCGLCGEDQGSTEGLWRDCTHRSELLAGPAEVMRRDIVRYMEDMGNIRWIPTQDMQFTTASPNGYDVVYKKNVVQYGLPYTQTFGCLERAQYCLEPDDYVVSWLGDFSETADTDPNEPRPAWDTFIGNDCSGALYWAWHRGCPSVSFRVTEHMVPTADNQAVYGVLPVGDYTAEADNTVDVIAANTPEKIMQCYALLYPGDGILMRRPGYGHTRLVSEDPVVMRDARGQIDPDESYVPTHEQGVGNRSSGRESTWQLRARYTFRELIAEYIPVTNRELLQGRPAPVQLRTEGVIGPMSGVVSTNYRVISSTVTMTCKATAQTWESTLFAQVIRKLEGIPGFIDLDPRITVRQVDLAAHAYEFRKLPRGEYNWTVTLLLSNGQSYAVGQGSCMVP